MDDNSVDLVLTSPPYNKGWYQYYEYTSNCKKKKINYGVYDDCLPPDEYEKIQRQIIEECQRVIKPTGSIFYNHIDIHSKLNVIHPTYVYDYPLRQIIIWDKHSTPQVMNTYFYPIVEYIFWIKKSKDAKPFFDRSNADFQKSIWQIEPDRHSEHPAPFPIELPTNIIKCCSKEGDIVYDPFMGSGTTAIAARNLNRHFIGSELNKDYIEMSYDRLGLI